MTRLAGPLEQQRARTAGLLAEAAAIAADHVIRDPERTALPVVLLPANPRSMVSLPAQASRDFLAHLDAMLDGAFAVAVRDNTQPMSSEDRASRVNAGDIDELLAPERLSPGMVAAACSACRGECCTAGGTHAFLRLDSLTRVRARMAEQGDDSRARIVAHYRHHLPMQHYRGSCVYHTHTGCALPRDLRSNLCNRYQCGELAHLEQVLEGAAPAAYVGAADPVRLRRLRRVEEYADGHCHSESIPVNGGDPDEGEGA